MNAIQDVLEHHVRPSVDVETEVVKLKALEEELVRKRDRLTWRMNHLLGVEQDAKAELQESVAELRRELKRVRLHRFLVEKKYPILAQSALRMRLPNGLPRFAFFDTDRGMCWFSYFNKHDSFNGPCFGTNYRGVWEDDLKERMAATLIPRVQKTRRRVWCVLPGVVSVLGAVIMGMNNVLPALIVAFAVLGIAAIVFGVWALSTLADGFTLTHFVQWSGLVPDDVRQTIGDAQVAGGKVFLLAEVEEWGATIKRDPLILVSDEKNLYVVRSFDTTPIEEYVRDEFSVSPS